MIRERNPQSPPRNPYCAPKWTPLDAYKWGYSDGVQFEARRQRMNRLVESVSFTLRIFVCGSIGITGALLLAKWLTGII